MSDIGTPMSGTVPAVGTAGTSYATLITAFLTEVKERLEARIPLDALLIGELDMVNNALSNVSNLLLYEQNAAPTDPVGSIQNYGGDLYWVSSSGAVQITTGATLNSASLGGITGDYGLGAEQFRYDAGDLTYLAYSDFGAGEWAYVKGLGFKVAGGASSAVAATIDWGGSSSYTVTLPTAAPAAQAIIQMEADGDLVASNVMAANQSITVSGTGTYKHGNNVISLDCGTRYLLASGTYTPYNGPSNNLIAGILASGGSWVKFPLTGLRRGDRIISVKLRALATQEPTLSIFDQVEDTAAALATTDTGTIVGTGSKTLTLDTPLTLGSNGEFVYIQAVSGASTVTCYDIDITFDRP